MGVGRVDVREWTGERRGVGNALAFKQPTWVYDIESGPVDSRGRWKRPLPSNHPRCVQGCHTSLNTPCHTTQCCGWLGVKVSVW
jgi:hypothetical protein